MDRTKAQSLIYLLVVSLAAAAMLVALGLTGQFHWSHALTLLTVACIGFEWLVIKLPEGDSVTLSIIAVLLALLFSSKEAPSTTQAVGALEVIAIGSLVGYGLTHRQPLLRLIFYVAHHIWAASLAGVAFVLASEYLPMWFLTSFHLPAIVTYIVIFSLTSTLAMKPFNARILRGARLPKTDLLYTVFLAPIALIVYYFFESRHLELSSLLIFALPLIGVLVTFRLYFNIDTTYGEVRQLYRISREFVAAMSQEETVQRVSEGIAQAISQLVSKPDVCLIYTYNDESNEYLLVNPNNGSSGPRIILPGHGLLGRTAFSGTGSIVNDVTLQDGLSPDERLWPAKTAILSHPLIAEQQQIGLLVLARSGKGFTADEFRLVSIVAIQAGVTLHNALMYEQSQQLADRDRLTDVLNQGAFAQRSQRIMSRARAADQPVALLYGDIDDFGKRINNTYGHATGDRVLVGVATVMKEIVGDRGLVGRSAGEEFFVLLPNKDDQEALEIADQIRQGVEEREFESDDHRQVRATISTGVAIFPRDAGDFASLRKQADRAAYLAKRMGKNRVCLYEDRKELIEQAVTPPEPIATGPTAQV